MKLIILFPDITVDIYFSVNYFIIMLQTSTKSKIKRGTYKWIETSCLKPKLPII